MNKYGELACLAANSLKRGSVTPLAAWKMHSKEIFPDSLSSREKSCPKNAFLGLVEAGILKDVQTADQIRTRDSINKRYAVRAYKLICCDNSFLDRPKKLWSKVVAGAQKVENQQIDVVISLWKNGYLNTHTNSYPSHLDECD